MYSQSYATLGRLVGSLCAASPACLAKLVCPQSTVHTPLLSQWASRPRPAAVSIFVDASASSRRLLSLISRRALPQPSATLRRTSSASSLPSFCLCAMHCGELRTDDRRPHPFACFEHLALESEHGAGGSLCRDDADSSFLRLMPFSLLLTFTHCVVTALHDRMPSLCFR